MTKREKIKAARLFPWFGGKAKIATRLPNPEHDTIVEPFCGGASYSLLHGADRDVCLYDIDPALIACWNWLIDVSEDEFDALPLSSEINTSEDVRADFGDEAEYFMRSHNNSYGFKTDKRLPPSQTGLTQSLKDKIRDSLQHIRHWRAEEKSWDKVRNRNATWFIDPPYQETHKDYVSNDVDYKHLAAWSKGRNGQAIVTERSPADWLPFDKMGRVPNAAGSNTGSGKKGKGAVYDYVWHGRSGRKVQYRAPNPVPNPAWGADCFDPEYEAPGEFASALRELESSFGVGTVIDSREVGLDTRSAVVAWPAHGAVLVGSDPSAIPNPERLAQKFRPPTWCVNVWQAPLPSVG